jgi:hypothetical protein
MALSHISVEAPLRVYDVTDPGHYGTIIKAGPEVSEVRFDDGPERNIPNSHLRPVESVDEELTRSTHPEEAVLDRGREAWNRLRTNSTWEDWKAVGKAHVIGQATAMRDAHVNKPKGRNLIRTNVERLIDADAWNAALRREARNRKLLDRAAENWTKVEKLLKG